MLQSIIFGRSIGIERILASQAGTRQPPVWHFLFYGATIFNYLLVWDSAFNFPICDVNKKRRKKKTKQQHPASPLNFRGGWTVHVRFQHTQKKKDSKYKTDTVWKLDILQNGAPNDYKMVAHACGKNCGGSKIYSLYIGCFYPKAFTPTKVKIFLFQIHGGKGAAQTSPTKA